MKYKTLLKDFPFGSYVTIVIQFPFIFSIYLKKFSLRFLFCPERKMERVCLGVNVYQVFSLWIKNNTYVSLRRRIMSRFHSKHFNQIHSLLEF